jgi:integrase
VPTIVKRGPYQWQAKVRRKGQAPQSKTFTTKADAEAWARELETEMHRGVFQSRAEAEHTTLNEALDRYAREMTPRKKGAERELRRIERWKRRAIAARHLPAIRGADLAQFRDELRADGKAENTIRLELALLSQVFETARKEWGMESLTNPVRNIKAPGGSRQRDRRLREREEEYLMAALECSSQPIARAVAAFAIETGMRQSEILGLTWDAVDMKRRVAHLAETKNGAARTVPLSTKALAILEGKGPHEPDDRIFPIAENWLRRVFAQACAAGRAQYLQDCAKSRHKPDKRFLDDLRFHDLRHEATTRFFERRLELMEVASITGHKTLSMLKRYTHLRAEDLARKLG